MARRGAAGAQVDTAARRNRSQCLLGTDEFTAKIDRPMDSPTFHGPPAIWRQASRSADLDGTRHTTRLRGLFGDSNMGTWLRSSKFESLPGTAAHRNGDDRLVFAPGTSNRSLATKSEWQAEPVDAHVVGTADEERIRPTPATISPCRQQIETMLWSINKIERCGY